jgi:hypothetical protein
MWNNVDARRSGTNTDRGTRQANRRRGFSHPARFERLEDRLPLNGAPTDAPPTAGTNPVDPALAGAGGVANTAAVEASPDTLAFNTPSWIPDDRPAFPSTAQPSDGLPANVNQVASTPYGIRNFDIGANTSAAHSAAVRIGRDTSTASIPTYGFDVDDEIAETDARAPLIQPTMAMLEKADLSFVEEQSHEPGEPDTVPTDEAPTLAMALPASPATTARPAVQLDTAAVDQMMTERPEVDGTTSDLAIAPSSSGPVSTESPEGVGSTIDFLAASGAVAATLAMPGNEASRQTVPEFSWRTKSRPEGTDDPR